MGLKVCSQQNTNKYNRNTNVVYVEIYMLYMIIVKLKHVFCLIIISIFIEHYNVIKVR